LRAIGTGGLCFGICWLPRSITNVFVQMRRFTRRCLPASRCWVLMARAPLLHRRQQATPSKRRRRPPALAATKKRIAKEAAGAEAGAGAGATGKAATSQFMQMYVKTLTGEQLRVHACSLLCWGSKAASCRFQRQNGHFGRRPIVGKHSQRQREIRAKGGCSCPAAAGSKFGCCSDDRRVPTCILAMAVSSLPASSSNAVSVWDAV
jgi:hypothetical protein